MEKNYLKKILVKINSTREMASAIPKKKYNKKNPEKYPRRTALKINSVKPVMLELE